MIERSETPSTPCSANSRSAASSRRWSVGAAVAGTRSNYQSIESIDRGKAGYQVTRGCSVRDDRGMPSTQVEVRRRWSEQDEAANLDAVHAALVAGFRIPPQDKHLAEVGIPRDQVTVVVRDLPLESWGI